MFDISKIKKSKLEDLVDKTLKVVKFRNEEESMTLVIAIDINDGCIYVLSIRAYTKRNDEVAK